MSKLEDITILSPASVSDMKTWARENPELLEEIDLESDLDAMQDKYETAYIATERDCTAAEAELKVAVEDATSEGLTIR